MSKASTHRRSGRTSRLRGSSLLVCAVVPCHSFVLKMERGDQSKKQLVGLLHIAARSGDLDVVKALIAAICDLPQ